MTSAVGNNPVDRNDRDGVANDFTTGAMDDFLVDDEFWTAVNEEPSVLSTTVQTESVDDEAAGLLRGYQRSLNFAPGFAVRQVVAMAREQSTVAPDLLVRRIAVRALPRQPPARNRN